MLYIKVSQHTRYTEDCAGSKRQHELDRTKPGLSLILKYFDHEVEIDDLSVLCIP